MDVENINPSLGSLVVEVETLRLDDRNARDHHDQNIRAIADSLSQFGQQKAIVILPDGKIIAGNGTFQAATGILGWKKIAAVVWNGDARRAQAFALADNRSSELAEWNYEELSTQLQEISAWEDGVVNSLGWSDLELRPLLESDWTPPEASDEEIEIKRRGDGDKTPLPVAPVGGMLCTFTAAQWHEVEQAIERYVKANPEEDTLESFEAAIVAMCRTVAR